MIWFRINLEIFFPVVKVRGMASNHLVKYSIVVMMNLWLLEEGGEIAPTRSNAHYKKGHGDMNSYSSCASAWIRLLCI